MSKLMNVHFAGAELMTGLPEYRNGGLFIDTGVLTLKKEDEQRGLAEFHRNAQREGKKSLEVVPMFAPDDDVIVEWRAVTVGFLDLLLVEVNKALGLYGNESLTLPQMLEAGSWKVCSSARLLDYQEYVCPVLTSHREVEKWQRSLAQTPSRLRLLSYLTAPSSKLYVSSRCIELEQKATA
jgi:hypothetical protein